MAHCSHVSPLGAIVAHEHASSAGIAQSPYETQHFHPVAAQVDTSFDPSVGALHGPPDSGNDREQPQSAEPR